MKANVLWALLAILLVLGLAACTGGDTALIGTWKGYYTLTITSDTISCSSSYYDDVWYSASSGKGSAWYKPDVLKIGASDFTYSISSDGKTLVISKGGGKIPTGTYTKQ